MNCCDDYGKCTQGRDCPARSSNPPEISNSTILDGSIPSYKILDGSITSNKIALSDETGTGTLVFASGAVLQEIRAARRAMYFVAFILVSIIAGYAYGKLI